MRSLEDTAIIAFSYVDFTLISAPDMHRQYQ